MYFLRMYTYIGTDDNLQIYLYTHTVCLGLPYEVFTADAFRCNRIAFAFVFKVSTSERTTAVYLTWLELLNKKKKQ